MVPDTEQAFCKGQFCQTQEQQQVGKELGNLRPVRVVTLP
jgi:hypothetical protein